MSVILKCPHGMEEIDACAVCNLAWHDHERLDRIAMQRFFA